MGVAARAWLHPAWLLAGCLSASEGTAAEDGPDASPDALRDASPDPAPCAAVAFTEGFDEDGWKDARWGNSWEPEGSNMLVAVEGRARVALRGLDEDYAYFETEQSFDWTDACVHVEVPVMGKYGTDIPSEAMLGVWMAEVEAWITVGQSQASICCRSEVAGEDNTTCAAAYDPQDHAWWRLRFDEGGVACDVS